MTMYYATFSSSENYITTASSTEDAPCTMMIPAILVLLVAALVAADGAGTKQKDQALISTILPYSEKGNIPPKIRNEIQRFLYNKTGCGLNKNCWFSKLSTTPYPNGPATTSQRKSPLRMAREIDPKPQLTHGFVKPHKGCRWTTTQRPTTTTTQQSSTTAQEPSTTAQQPNDQRMRFKRNSPLRMTRGIPHEAVNADPEHKDNGLNMPEEDKKMDDISEVKSAKAPVPVQRILGGRKASLKEFPSMLSIWVLKGNSMSTLSYVCGATILNDQWALTAAHCLMDFDASKVFVRAGSYSKSNKSSDHPAEKFIMHEQFTLHEGKDFFLKDDIAVIKVSERFSLNNRTVKSAHLPRQGMVISPGTNATAVGWGESGTTTSELLQAADLKIISKDSCADLWSKQNAKLVKSSILCTQDSSKRFCGGSSGSPLFIKGQVVGIASAHLDVCVKTDLPGVHMDVAYYRDWIWKKTGV